MANMFRHNSTKKNGFEKHTLFLAVMLPFASVLMVPAGASDCFSQNSRRVECLVAIQERQRRISEFLGDGSHADHYKIIPFDVEIRQTTPHPTFNLFTEISSLENEGSQTAFLQDENLFLSKYTKHEQFNDPLRGPPSWLTTY